LQLPDLRTFLDAGHLEKHVRSNASVECGIKTCS
jgi:hypothetical protein